LTGAGQDWGRAAAPFLALMGGLGAGAIASGAVVKDLASDWAAAPAGSSQQVYLVAFDAMSRVTENLFFAAFVAMGLYLALLAPAIRRDGAFPRWTGWMCALSAAFLIAGNLLSLRYEAAFLVVLA